MNFNPHPSKQAQEVLFSRKLYKVSHTKLLFNNADDPQANSHNYVGVVLDSKLMFHDHLDIAFTKVRKTIDLLRKLNSILFFRPYLDCGVVLYEQAFNITFQDKLE